MVLMAQTKHVGQASQKKIFNELNLRRNIDIQFTLYGNDSKLKPSRLIINEKPEIAPTTLHILSLSAIE